MTSIKTLALVAMAVAAGITAAGRDFQDWSNLNHYRASNAEARQLPPGERRVVFLGNSITYNWARFRADFFKGNGYIGRGISGQTTYQLLSRFREDVVGLHPRIVVINAGVNDVAENSHPYCEELTVGNIASMVEIAQANGITPVLTTVLPAAAFTWRREITDSSAKITSLNARLRALAADKGTVFVDYYSSMLAPGDPALALNPAFTDDGVHPTAEGYAVMEAVIQPVLQALLAE